MLLRRAAILLSLYFAVLAVQAFSAAETLSFLEVLPCTAVLSNTGTKASCGKARAAAMSAQRLHRKKSSEEISMGKQRLARSAIRALTEFPLPEEPQFALAIPAEPAPPSITLPSEIWPPSGHA